jgi:hypothetical protein
MAKDNLHILKALQIFNIDRRGSTVSQAYINVLINLFYTHSQHLKDIDTGKLFTLIWSFYANLNTHMHEMAPEQGKYFIMLTHLGINCAHHNPDIR